MPLFSRRLSLAALVALVGCAGSPAPAAPDPASEGPVRDLWLGLDASEAALSGSGSVETCSGRWGTWFEHFGVRGLACVAAQVVGPAELLALAPVEPFRSGPHVATSGRVALDLDAARTFGQYDPAFVEWAAAAFVPESATLRSAINKIRAIRLGGERPRITSVSTPLGSISSPEEFPGSVNCIW